MNAHLTAMFHSPSSRYAHLQQVLGQSLMPTASPGLPYGHYYGHISSPATPVDDGLDEFGGDDFHCLSPYSDALSDSPFADSVTSAPSDAFCDPKAVEAIAPYIRLTPYYDDAFSPSPMPAESMCYTSLQPLQYYDLPCLPSGSSDCTDSEEELFEPVSIPESVFTYALACPPPVSSPSPALQEPQAYEEITAKVKRRGRKPSLVDDPTKHFMCVHCNRRFRRHEHLKRHFRSLHTHEKPFRCDECSKSFSRSDNLSQHVRTHVRDESQPHSDTACKAIPDSPDVSASPRKRRPAIHGPSMSRPRRRAR